MPLCKRYSETPLPPFFILSQQFISVHSSQTSKSNKPFRVLKKIILTLTTTRNSPLCCIKSRFTPHKVLSHRNSSTHTESGNFKPLLVSMPSCGCWVRLHKLLSPWNPLERVGWKLYILSESTFPSSSYYLPFRRSGAVSGISRGQLYDLSGTLTFPLYLDSRTALIVITQCPPLRPFICERLPNHT